MDSSSSAGAADPSTAASLVGRPGPAEPAGRRPATDAEARALASSVRLRILRMCLDAPMTNAQLAERLARPPASVLHHVRTLVDTGFLEALPAQQGARGSRPRPYRATRKSWRLDDPAFVTRPMLEAFAAEVQRAPATDLHLERLGLRLDEAGHAELQERLHALLEDFASRPSTPGGRPWSVFVSVHPDPDRD